MATYLIRDVSQDEIKAFKIRCLLSGSNADDVLRSVIRDLPLAHTLAVQAAPSRCGSSPEMSPPRADQ